MFNPKSCLKIYKLHHFGNHGLAGVGTPQRPQRRRRRSRSPSRGPGLGPGETASRKGLYDIMGNGYTPKKVMNMYTCI